MTRFYCDSCGEEGTTKFNEYWRRGIFWSIKRKFELCEGCADRFELFLKASLPNSK